MAVVVITSPFWIWAFILPYVCKYERRRQEEEAAMMAPTGRKITLNEKLEEEAWALNEGWSPCTSCGGPVKPGTK